MRAERSLPESGSAERTALELTLRPLRVVLDDPRWTELCINRPGEAFIEQAEGWIRRELPFATFAWCSSLARLIANASRQRIDSRTPLLSATLSSGERAQLVVPPATTAGTVSITLRRASAYRWTLDELQAQQSRAVRLGHGTAMGEGRGAASPPGSGLGDLLRDAVRTRKNILVSGPTGSGKTTWTNALIREIPAGERLIAIEDARELVLDHHPNHVRLYYSKGGQGQAQVSPKQLLECSLRMRPDRILLAELRGEEALHYLRNINSGHPGSITSIHAGSPALAFEQLTLLVKESAAGRDLSRADIQSLLRPAVDIVIQVGLDGHTRVVREVWCRGESEAALPSPRAGLEGCARP